MNWIFNKMDYKWIGLEQKWIGSRKLDFLHTPNDVITFLYWLKDIVLSKTLKEKSVSITTNLRMQPPRCQYIG